MIWIELQNRENSVLYFYEFIVGKHNKIEFLKQKKKEAFFKVKNEL